MTEYLICAYCRKFRDPDTKRLCSICREIEDLAWEKGVEVEIVECEHFEKKEAVILSANAPRGDDLPIGKIKEAEA